jgi:hypothetical protein
VAQKAAWEKDAEDFGRRFRFGEWESTLLVARSVQEFEPSRKGDSRNSRLDRERAQAVGRTTSSEFARRADVDVSTVRAYVRTWKLAAKDGLVPPADQLVPGKDPEADLPEGDLWTKYYRKANPGKTIRPHGKLPIASEGVESIYYEIVAKIREAVASIDEVEGGLLPEAHVTIEVACREIEVNIAETRRKISSESISDEVEEYLREQHDAL